MIKWTDESWTDYLYWQVNDKKVLKRINMLIKDIQRNGNIEGIGKPEALKYDYQGFYSRRIDEKNRLVYVLQDDILYVVSCRYHY